jgi:hypothetical protein
MRALQAGKPVMWEALTVAAQGVAEVALAGLQDQQPVPVRQPLPDHFLPVQVVAVAAVVLTLGLPTQPLQPEADRQH